MSQNEAAAEAQPQVETKPVESRALKLEMTARIGAVLLFAAPSLAPIVAPGWDWPAANPMVVTCGGIPLAFIFYTVVHGMATRAARSR